MSKNIKSLLGSILLTVGVALVAIGVVDEGFSVASVFGGFLIGAWHWLYVEVLHD